MYDNKIRISKDVIEKAQMIADAWGLKTPRVALEAVFRKYADEYMYGRLDGGGLAALGVASGPAEISVAPVSNAIAPKATAKISMPGCEAIDELDDLLAM